MAVPADSTQCDITLSLATEAFCGQGSARIDVTHWTAFLDQCDRVVKGEQACAELQTGKAGVTLQLHDRGDDASVVFLCTLSHPSFLGAETAIYATSAEFRISKDELQQWLKAEQTHLLGRAPGDS